MHEPSPEHAELALKIKRLVQERGWNQEDFARIADLNRHTVRVYHLQADLFRVDTTTANSYVEVLSELGYFQFGHSKDNDDQPQIKVAMATLDPLGMPVTTFVVPGDRADDPLYVPEIKKVQHAFGLSNQVGFVFIGSDRLVHREFDKAPTDRQLQTALADLT